MGYEQLEGSWESCQNRTVFQRWMDLEGREVVRQKVALMNNQLMQGQASGTGAEATGNQNLPQKQQQAQPPISYRDMAWGGDRITDVLLTTTRLRRQDTKEDAKTRAAAALSNFFSVRQLQGVQRPEPGAQGSRARGAEWMLVISLFHPQER